MVGAFAVGKTSLVRRYVEGIFDEKYLTTIGVKIDKKKIVIEGRELEFILWDIEGEDEFTSVRTNYLKGASVLLLVIDGTRRESLDIALSIKQAADDSAKTPYQCVVLLNKSDLSDHWEVTDQDIQAIEAAGMPIIKTSAKTDTGVEQAFHQAGRIILNHHG